MKYYRIRHSHKEIGLKFPQVETGIGDFNVNHPSYIGSETFFLSKIKNIPILPEMVLYKSANLTDLISSSFMGTGSGLILSNKLYSLIYKYTDNTQQFFKIKLHHKNIACNEYWYLHPSITNNELIDFSKSEIWELHALEKNEKREFKDLNEFNEELKTTKYPKMLSIDKYVLNQNITEFFILNFIEGGIGFFVSKKLKNEIEEAGCTGIVFTEPNERYP